MTPRPVFGDDRYRTIGESHILDLLLFDGWRFAIAAGRRPAAMRAARDALERCIAMGLPYLTTPAGARLFDPAEATSFLKWAGLNRSDKAWDQVVATARRQLWERQPPPADFNRPPALRELGARRYALTIRRTFNLAGRLPGEPVRLRLPAPLEDECLHDLSVEPILPAGIAVDATQAPGRLDMKLSVPEAGSVCIGMRAGFTVRPWRASETPSLDSGEAELYTRRNEGLIRVSERVEALAAALCGTETDPLRIVRRFWTYLLDDLAFGAIHYNELDPERPLDWTLEHGWYDCQAGSALLAALCRARGLPARLVTGYLLYEAAPGFHTWLEVWIEDRGWLPFDLSSWNLAAGGADPAWRDHFFGRLDHRVVTERPPRIFGGTGAVRLPDTWQMLNVLTKSGAAATFETLESCDLIYREDVAVEYLGEA